MARVVSGTDRRKWVVRARDLEFGSTVKRLRAQDLAVARISRKLGAYVMLVGQNLAQDAGHLVFSDSGRAARLAIS